MSFTYSQDTCLVTIRIFDRLLTTTSFLPGRPDSFQLRLSLTYSQLTVSCATAGGYPTPELFLYLRGDLLQNSSRAAVAGIAYSRDNNSSGRPVAVTSVLSLDQLGDSERISCVLRLPRTNFSLGRTELFHKYPTRYPARFMALAYTSSAPAAHRHVPPAVYVVLLYAALYLWLLA